MDAIELIAFSALWAFTAGYAYADGKRLLGVGVLAFGLGTQLVRNPFPTGRGDLYAAVAVVLVVGGLVLILGSAATWLIEQDGPARAETG